VVTFKNLSAYDGDLPGDGKTRKIADGPLYDLARIKALTELPDAVKFWTAKARRDAANLAMAPADVGGMIRQLTEHDYRDSEWCDNGKGSCAACDAYALTRDEYVEHAGKSYRMVYFLKFAESRTGKLVLIVSCPTSN
jgi:hypothetical protein